MCSIANECDTALAPALVCSRLEQGGGPGEQAMLYHTLRVCGLHPCQQLGGQALSCLQRSLHIGMPGASVSIASAQQWEAATAEEKAQTLQLTVIDEVMPVSARRVATGGSPGAFQHCF